MVQLRLILALVIISAVAKAQGNGKAKGKDGGANGNGKDKKTPPGQLKKVEKYLRQYGYVAEGEGNQVRQLTDAIKKAQRYAGCPMTGNYKDPCLTAAMKQRRCGLPDMDRGRPFSRGKGKGQKNGKGKSNRAKRYVLISKWLTTDVKYSFDDQDGTQDLPIADQRAIFEKCVKEWNKHSGLNITKAANDAHIPMSFGTYNHGDGKPFDGPIRIDSDGELQGVVLAHASPPPGKVLHYDDSETWATPENCRDGYSTDLLAVCIHEVGHSLGLHHSQTRDAIMYASYLGCGTGYLRQDDIDGIQSLYGTAGVQTTTSPPVNPNGCPKATDFPCENGEHCVPQPWICDGVNDCSDGTDESQCGCTFTRVPCPSGSGCTWKTWFCDGENDCSDGSDEQGCAGCKDTEIDCLNGKCVPYSLRCDGNDDCGNGHDEIDC